MVVLLQTNLDISRLYLATPFKYEDMEPYTLLWQFRF